MTPRSRSRPNPNPDESPGTPGRFGSVWNELTAQGQTPELDSRTVREAAEREESKGRKTRPIQPTEQRRRGRKITPALPRALVADLRRVCREYGYEGEDGTGIVASSVIRSLLTLVIQLYQDRQLELVEEEVAVPERHMRFQTGGTSFQVPLPEPPRSDDQETISPTLPGTLIAELRAIGRDLGYTRGEGSGMVAADVVEMLLRTAVELHDRGLLETAEGTVPSTTRRLVWRPRRR